MVSSIVRTSVNLKDVLRAYGDGNLFGEPHGEGPVQVVWLHGWARSSHDFAEAADELAKAGVASVALDLPGFGSSPLPTVAGGARLYAELLAPALSSMSDRPLVLVGHSFGGTVATVLAADHPELVRTLILTGSPLLRRTGVVASPWRFRLTRWLHAKGVVGEGPMEAARQRYGSTDYKNASGRLREVLVASVSESYEEELHRINVPVVMIWGELDTDVPVEIARRAAALLPTPPTIRVLTGVGHFVPTLDPGALVASAREALA